MRRFPPPWKVEALEGGFKIVDSNGQALAYVYGHADPRHAGIANALTLDEARRIASNIAKLSALRQRKLMRPASCKSQDQLRGKRKGRRRGYSAGAMAALQEEPSEAGATIAALGE